MNNRGHKYFCKTHISVQQLQVFSKQNPVFLFFECMIARMFSIKESKFQAKILQLA